MRRRRWATALGVLALAAVATASQAAVNVTMVDYQGWKNVYRLENGTVELIVVPQIGRIMHYGYIGGPNMLWVNPALHGKIGNKTPNNEWVNFGGDKVWPSPQSKWNANGWPPDTNLDGSRHRVRMLPNHHLILLSLASQKFGLRFQREIALDETGTGVSITNTMHNTSQGPINWGIWEVTQVDDPDVIKLPLHKGGHFSSGYYTFKDADPQPGMLTVTDTEVQLKRNTAKACKIGNDAPEGWIRAEKAGITFEVSAEYDASKTYPDDGCGQEIYTNPDPLKYIEMELLSPMPDKPLPSGEKANFTTHWKLSRS